MKCELFKITGIDERRGWFRRSFNVVLWSNDGPGYNGWPTQEDGNDYY